MRENSPEVVEGQPILDFFEDPGKRIQWSISAHREMYAHLARYRLDKHTLRVIFLEHLLQRMNCAWGGDFAAIVRPKVVSSLAYKLSLLKKNGIVTRNPTGPGRDPVVWPAWTAEWAAEGWNGDTSPPPGLLPHIGHQPPPQPPPQAPSLPVFFLNSIELEKTECGVDVGVDVGAGAVDTWLKSTSGQTTLVPDDDDDDGDNNKDKISTRRQLFPHEVQAFRSADAVPDEVGRGGQGPEALRHMQVDKKIKPIAVPSSDETSTAARDCRSSQSSRTSSTRPSRPFNSCAVASESLLHHDHHRRRRRGQQQQQKQLGNSTVVVDAQFSVPCNATPPHQLEEDEEDGHLRSLLSTWSALNSTIVALALELRAGISDTVKGHRESFRVRALSAVQAAEQAEAQIAAAVAARRGRRHGHAPGTAADVQADMDFGMGEVRGVLLGFGWAEGAVTDYGEGSSVIE